MKTYVNLVDRVRSFSNRIPIPASIYYLDLFSCKKSASIQPRTSRFEFHNFSSLQGFDFHRAVICGQVRIFLHHSSVPYSADLPSVTEEEVLQCQANWASAIKDISKVRGLPLLLYGKINVLFQDHGVLEGRVFFIMVMKRQR